MTPDFFLIGAPKGGTSALYDYLSDHASCCLPQNKEPHFFAEDMYVRETGLSRRVKDPDRYAAHFEGCAPGALTGEGSTWYLYSQVAVPKIEATGRAPKYIVMLRNPVEAAQSLHRHHVRKLYDDVEDFATAWDLSETRAEGAQLPHHCPDPKMLDYHAAYSFAPQLRRLFAKVPRERVLIHIYEEFFSDPATGYARTLDFLGLPQDGRSEFGTVNPNRSLRNKTLYRLLTYKPFPLNLVYPAAKRVANALGLRPGQAVFERNVRVEKRVPLDAETRRRVKDAFRQDIAETEEILGRTLECWS